MPQGCRRLPVHLAAPAPSVPELRLSLRSEVSQGNAGQGHGPDTWPRPALPATTTSRWLV